MKTPLQSRVTDIDHLLIATDGSMRSEDAVRRGVALAGAIGARVTFFRAVPHHGMAEGLSTLIEETRGDHEKAALAKAAEHLLFVSRIARAHGVPSEATHAFSDAPWKAIVEMAQSRGCNLIVMASHGRRGLERILLGSETKKVIDGCHIPVLVLR